MNERQGEVTEYRPKRLWTTHLTECLRYGHQPGDWQPRTAVLTGDVVGARKYCLRCGARLDHISFLSEPERSDVFADRDWYPERLSCYYEAEDIEMLECFRCGSDAPYGEHMELDINDFDLTPPHEANRDWKEERIILCDGCADTLAEWLDFDRAETKEVVPA